MKKLMLVCLLGACAPMAALAQDEVGRADFPAFSADGPKGGADVAKRDEEAEKTRAKLDEARARLDKAAREVAELSAQLGESERRNVFFFQNGGGPEFGERRAMLGVQIDPESGKNGARVQSVSPGGPAADAGLEAGDIITSLDGKSIVGTADSGRTLVEKMRDVKPDQKVKVRVLRAGKNKDLVVIARPMVIQRQFRTFRNGDPEAGAFVAGTAGVPAMPGMAGMPPVTVMRMNAMPDLEFRGMFGNEFGGLELASLTPKLGAYFGANDGVLVVQAPESGAFKLEDGDVIQSIDGRKPEDGAHALRILRSYKPGEKLNLNVLRQRKALTLAITMPERPEMFDHFTTAPMPVMPGTPPSPPSPPVPGSGAGTLD